MTSRFEAEVAAQVAAAGMPHSPLTVSANGLALYGVVTVTAVPDSPAEPVQVHLRAKLAALQGKLANLAAIEQAKGALMATYGLTADAAFELLRFHSQTGNVKLSAIAVQLTSLLSTSPSNSQAITQFDRLIDTVTQRLQAARGPEAAPRAVNPPGDTPTAVYCAAPDDGSRFPAPATPPGITIAINVANLPLIYANSGFAELTGYPIGDILGRNCRFLQGPATNPNHISTLGHALHAGRDVSVIMRNYRSDGSPFLNKVSISPIRDPDNQITHYIATQIDVTRAQQSDHQARR
jgi:PAS domain S-box-containing protein